MKPCKICNKPQDGGYIICAECAEEVKRTQAELIDYYHTQKVVDGQMEQNQRLRRIIEKLTARAEKAERERDAAVEDLYEACRRSPCNNGICIKKNCTGNIIPCDFEWCGVQKEENER